MSLLLRGQDYAQYILSYIYAIEELKNVENPTDEDIKNIEHFEKQLKEASENFKEKSDAYCYALKNLESDEETLEKEIKRLQERKKSIQNAQNSVKNLIKFNLGLLGIDKIKTSIFTLSLRASQSVNILNFDLVPEKYKKQKIEVAIDKNMIKDSLKSGETVEGVELVENKSVQVR